MGTSATIRSVEIDAFGARMTRLILALVYIQTTLGTGDKSVAASALVVDAHFVAFAADVGRAAGLASTIDTQFAGQAVTVAVTYLRADTVLATFALRAIVLLRALTLTQSRDAQMLTGTVLRGLTCARHSNATLLRSGITVETERTRARNRMIRATTDRVWSAYVFSLARILTLVVDTRLDGRAVFIAATTEDATSASARLIHLTLRMRDARYHALVVDTFLSVRAIGDRTTHSSALPIETHAVLAFGIRRAVICTPYAAVFRALRGRHESVDAAAARPAVHDLAERVRAARVLARIHAAMLVADGMHRAVLGAGAVSLRLAAVRVRIAHVIRRAPAHRLVRRRTGDAERRRMTGVRTAGGLDGDALDVGHRIRAQSRRALADRLVIVRDAHGVRPARVLVAGVVAGVREPVAELRRRAVDVVDAGHRSATGRRVVRIAGVRSGRALAVGHVIIDDAERVRAAGDEVADQLAGERTVRGAATRPILRALAVAGATVRARALTAPAIVRIAGVARQAVATAVMVLRHATGVRGAGETVAERHALEHAERVGPASLARTAVVVAYAIGHRRLLARRQYRVPLVTVLTLAGSVTEYEVGFAFLIGAAHHLAAGIHAVAYTAVQGDAERTRLTVRVVRAARYHGLGRLTTLDQITRIALVAVDAQAGRYVILRDAQCIGSALQFAAGVHALANTFADLEADLLGLALEVVRAVTVQVTALVQIVGIAAVTRRTRARSVLTNGSRAAFYVAALVYALVIDAGVIEGARYGVAADASRWIGARARLHLPASDEGIAEEAVLATTIVASDGIDAHRIAATCISVAFVDVEALNKRIASEARWAEALDSIGTCVAMRVLPAHRGGAIGFLLDAAAVIRIAAGTRIADTF